MIEQIKDQGRLTHILQAIEYVEAFTNGLSLDDLTGDALHLHAVAHNIQIIGEAVCKLSSKFKVAHPETHWHVIEKMRHVLVHDYYQIDNEVLWDVIKNDLPKLKEQVIGYLK